MLITTKSGNLEIKAGECLLEVLEKNGYVIEYQCRSGYCGSCRIKLNKGQVEYNSPPLAAIHADEILPCCCIVKEDLNLDISRPDSSGSSWQESFFDFDQLSETASQFNQSKD